MTARNRIIAAYVRTSTRKQDGEAQRHAIEQALSARGKAVDAWFEDAGWSGADDTRPELERLLKAVRAGKVGELCVYKLDRLGRSLQHLVSTLDTIRRCGCAFYSLGDGIDSESAAGRMQLGVMAAFSEFEREIIVERGKAGMERIRAEAKELGDPVSHRFGAPTSVTPDQLAEARYLREQGYSWQAVAKAVRVPKSTIRGAVERGTAYVIVPPGEWRRDLRRGVRECPPAAVPHRKRQRTRGGSAT